MSGNSNLLLKIVIFSFIIIFNQLALSQERVTIAGPFMVCSEGHFIHKKCPDLDLSKTYRIKQCPTCIDLNLVEVSTAIFSLKSEDCCAICLEPHIPRSLFKKRGFAK